MQTERLVTLLNAAADAVIAAEPQLSDADRRLGDGDHGLGMQRGMTAVKAKLDAKLDGGEFATIDAVLIAVGTTMMTSMGGASGALFGTLFRAGGKALAGRDVFDAAAFADFLLIGGEAVAARGGAEPGDKTMVDALQPAAQAGDACRDQSVGEALAAAAEAAENGRDATADMIATCGRAKTLGEKSRGYVDPGACSVAILLRAMADAGS